MESSDTMAGGMTPESQHRERAAALTTLALSAANNVPGADLASITLRNSEGHLSTLAATDSLAEQADNLQYELREGPCYDAVTTDRFVLINDLSAAKYPHYGLRAVGLGLGAQAAI